MTSVRIWMVLATIILLVSLVPGGIPMTRAQASPPSAPATLEVTISPTSIPADGGTYPCIFVSLLDASNRPTLATAKTVVILTSSNTAVGSVLNSSVVIPAGQQYVAADFESTQSTGQTVITATATGFTAASATVTTSVPRGYPTAISISAVPSEINSTSTRTGTLIVELRDDAGSPAKAVEDTNVSLYSSSTDILSLQQSNITIKAGQFIGLATLEAGYVPGTASVTASAPGLSSGSSQITVLGRTPLALQVYAQPSKMVTCAAPAVASCTGRLVISLSDANGNPTLAPKDMTVYIRSSNLTIVTIPHDSVTLQAGDLSAIASFDTTANQGTAQITVSSEGLKSSFAGITTSKPMGLIGLQLYVGPAVVLANDKSYSSVVVSLVNKTGFASVNDTGPTKVILTSSRSDVGDIAPPPQSALQLTIPEGNNYEFASFNSTFQTGTSQLTASSHNLLSSQADISTYGSVPARVTASAILPTILADGTVYPALEVSLEDSHGAPAVAGGAGVQVDLTSNPSGIALVDPVTIQPGQSAALVNVTTTPASGSATITALLPSGSGYTFSTAQINTVTAAPSAIGAYIAPGFVVQSPTKPQVMLVVQLQDSGGDPARARELTNLTITSSNAAVYNKTLLAHINQSASYVRVPVIPLAEGTTTFTVTSLGLTSGKATLQVGGLGVASQLVPSRSLIFLNQTSALTLSLTLDGEGIPDANVTWKATGGTIAAPKLTTNTQGEALATFTPSTTGIANITAVVSSVAIGAENLHAKIEVIAAQKSSKSVTKSLFAFPYYLIFVAAAAGVLVAVILLVRRRGRGEESDEETGEFMIARLPLWPGGGRPSVWRTLM